MPKVSIITATYNSEEEIVKTYESIRNQSYEDWEWLVTDDCSSDNTFTILKKIRDQDSRVRIFKNSVNSGAAVSRNNSISNVTGEFVAFLDSDDIWMPDKLSIQLGFMEDNKVDFSFTSYELIGKNGELLQKQVDKNQTGSFSYHDMLRKKATLGCSTVMLRGSAFKDIYMPLIRTGQDYATWLKLLKTGKNAYIINTILTQYRIMPNSISRNKFKKSKRQWQIYRNIEKLNLPYSIYCFALYAWRAVFRK
ncbi:glycosyltransferase family 2 protein [Vibrio parahaemolyticus]|nr:glycosyltransferase family 2 protein [Vibrio parahaemolyticus]EJG1574959.1 glycosyltransferase family 2 protein [Vibrio parahaemolyticus]